MKYNPIMLLKVQKPERVQTPIDRVITAASGIILGKEKQVRLALACLLARGHLLIEDLPGVGKTTLAHVLARTLGLHFQRVQFTSDMLPADIIGVSVYERDGGTFKFHRSEEHTSELQSQSNLVCRLLLEKKKNNN